MYELWHIYKLLMHLIVPYAVVAVTTDNMKVTTPQVRTQIISFGGWGGADPEAI